MSSDPGHAADGNRLPLDAPTLDPARYEVLGELARGGMGKILLVRDLTLDRRLALKTTHDALEFGAADEGELSRFLNEAQVAAQLDHPGVVPVHELGADKTGRPFFTMRLVKGESVQEVFDRARAGADGWSATRGLEVLLKICDTLAYAHSRGVIHRDLKPANVMVGRFGEVYVLDWGLARVLGRKDLYDLRVRAPGPEEASRVWTRRAAHIDASPGSPLVTMDGTVLGTPCFMSPEQARGETGLVDAVSDVYAVGALLYCLLTGRQPFTSPGQLPSPYAVLESVQRGPPEPARRLAPRAPAELVSICEKAMARERGDRYGSMTELADDVRAYLERRIVKAYRTGALAEIRKWVSRNRVAATGAACTVLAVVAGLGAFAWSQAKARRAGIEREAEARLDAYIGNLAAAQAALDADDTRLAVEHLDACPAELRGLEWRHLHFTADSSLLVLTGHSGPVTAVSVSADGRWIVSGGEDLTVRIWDADTGECVEVLRDLPAPPSAVGFTADGCVCAAGASGARFWKRAPGLPAQPMEAGLDFLIGNEPRDGAVPPEIDPRLYARAVAGIRGVVAGGAPWPLAVGRKTIALGLRSGGIDVTRDEVRRTLEGHAAAVCDLSLSQDERTLLSASADGTLRCWDLDSGRHAVIGERRAPVRSVALTRDGRWIVSGGDDGVVRLADAVTLLPLDRLRGHLDGVTQVTVFPDGRRIVSASRDGTARVWDLLSSRPAPSLRMAGTRRSSATAAGDRIVEAYGTGLVVARDTVAGGVQSVLSSSPRHAVVALAASGPETYAALSDGTLGAWGSDGSWTGLGRCSDPPVALVVAREAQAVVLLGADGALQVWDLLGRRPARRLEGAGALPVLEAAGSSLWAASESGEVLRWDLAACESRPPLCGHRARITALRASPDGSRLASGDILGEVRIWELASGTSVRLEGAGARPVVNLLWDGDGTRVLSASADGTIRTWRGDSGRRIAFLKVSREVRLLALKGSDLISIGADGSLQLLRQRIDPMAAGASWARSTLVEEAWRVAGEHLASEVATDAAIRAIEADASRPAGVREEAARLVRIYGGDAEAYNEQAWAVVVSRTRGKDEYERCLRLARRAHELEPGRADYLRTLGAALFRCEQLEEAVQKLRAAEAAFARDGRTPTDNALLLCMALSRLRGNSSEEAKAARAVYEARREKQGVPMALMMEAIAEDI